jgi:hypothetical protein
MEVRYDVVFRTRNAEKGKGRDEICKVWRPPPRVGKPEVTPYKTNALYPQLSGAALAPTGNNWAASRMEARQGRVSHPR